MATLHSVKIKSTEEGSERGFSLRMTVRLQSEQKGLNATIKLTDDTAVLTDHMKKPQHNPKHQRLYLSDTKLPDICSTATDIQHIMLLLGKPDIIPLKEMPVSQKVKLCSSSQFMNPAGPVRYKFD